MDYFEYGILRWRTQHNTFSAELERAIGVRPLDVESELAALDLLGGDSWEAVSREAKSVPGSAAGHVFLKRKL